MHAVIFANGEPPESPFNHPYDLLIAADGGAQHASRLGLLPGVVIGDLDSLPRDLEADLRTKGVRIIQYPENKDQSDLELALDYAAAAGATEITCLALLGGRPDMSLANLLTLASPRFRKIRMQAAAGATALHVLHGPGKLSLQGAAGDRVSAVPLNGDAAGVTYAGLAWPLQDETLAFGAGRGLSNRMAADLATISLKEGVLLITHEKKEA